MVVTDRFIGLQSDIKEKRMIDFFRFIVLEIAEILHVPYDKLLHFGVNFALAMTGFFRIWLAVGLCIGASIGKEYGDMNAKDNRWSWGDILADLLGMALGLGIVTVLKTVFNT